MRQLKEFAVSLGSEGLLIIFAIVFILSTTALLIFRASSPPEPVVAQGVGFDAALAESQMLGEKDIVSDLWALSHNTPGLVWNVQNHVLVATWTDYSGYDGHENEFLVLQKDVWVTPVPQVMNKCREFNLSGDALDNRLRAYLGLSPRGKQSRVVELWVNPAEVFRPCPDGEVTDTVCKTGLPEIPDDKDVAKISDARTWQRALIHAKWFRQNFFQYYSSGALPWTRLGYTYDWANPSGKVGASEYVIPKRTRVRVSSITRTQPYCTGSTPPPLRTGRTAATAAISSFTQQ